MDYLKEPHTALFAGPTSCGKTEKALQLLENEYKNYFDFIIIISPTLRYNKTYLCRQWIRNDDYVSLINPGDYLFEWIEKLGDILAGWKTLFLLDDIIADESLNKKRTSLLELAISGRHKNHSLWILTQSYCAVPRDIRRQLKMIYVWYPKDRNDLMKIHEENDVIETNEELASVKKKLKNGKHTSLVMRIEYPRSYDVL